MNQRFGSSYTCCLYSQSSQVSENNFPQNPSLQESLLFNLHSIRPSLSALLPSNPISNLRRRPKVHRQNRTLTLTNTSPIDDVRNIKPPLPELIVSASHMSPAQLDRSKSIEAVEEKPGISRAAAAVAVAIRFTGQSLDRTTRVSPITQRNPSQIEIVQVMVRISNHPRGEKVQVCLAGETGWDGDVEGVVR